MKESTKYLETIPEMFAYSCEKYGDLIRFGEKKDGVWKTYTFREVRDIIEALALGIHAMGFKHGDRLAIMSENCKEWTITDLACAHLGVVSVAVYPTLPANQVQYILEHAGVSAIMVPDTEQLNKVKEIKKDLPELKYCFTFEDLQEDTDWVLPYSGLLKSGEELKKSGKNSLESLGKKIKKNDLWTLIYTSGTTGKPKGVMLSNFNVCSNAQAAMTVIKIPSNTRFLSFLPLSHSFERIVSHGSYYCGSQVFFAESLEKIADNLKEVKPHYMFAVPRIFEKVYAKIHAQVASGSPLKQKIFRWAKKVGETTATKFLIYGKRPRGIYAINYPIAKALVFKKISKILGGEFIYAVSGGAPLPEHIGTFFSAAGINILEGFGLTETSPVTHLTPPGKIKFGKVGQSIPGVECKIDPDGEILIRGHCVMQGYYKNPLETAETIDQDGWLHTGDIGLIDEDGYLKITDRKKNIIVTAAGKNIAPAPIENKMLESKYIEQVVVIGDRRKYPIALIVPAREELEKWAQQEEIIYTNYYSLLGNDKIYGLFEKELQQFQDQLARYEKAKKILLIADPFSIENEELTPSLKVRRNIVEQHYKKQIDALYGKDDD
ncbi:MAG: long-chain fatty acid--CoA ligase [Candidatus Neomarinimicrobiota bacterium]|jgi:long-chain acyl-CoA synthetase|nr:long-chain fatty acid--CoA ligase [Candidatus Neomarinimicrobiota bacterium]MDD5709479.1 long-chain fatty acid--CoA ligase [Candidatus Neomarinimicrobiota bacterium]MDX9780228.1 long-chain fatty acid--CoA ligase [bacterium]